MENIQTFDLEELIQDNFDEYLGGTRDFTNCTPFLDTHNQFCWQWPEEVGHGFFSHIKLRDGLSIAMGNVLLHEPVHIRFDNWHLPLTFAYAVCGNMNYTIELENGDTSRWCAEPG